MTLIQLDIIKIEYCHLPGGKIQSLEPIITRFIPYDQVRAMPFHACVMLLDGTSEAMEVYVLLKSLEMLTGYSGNLA